MKLLGTILLVLVVLLAVFAALNWGAVNEPAQLSFGITRARAPLGLVLLGAAALLTISFTALVVILQAVALLHARGAARDIQEQRALADKAEESRFTELRAHLDGALRDIAVRRTGGQDDGRLVRLEERLAGVEQGLSGKLSDVGNALFAHLGEIEDKIDRALLKTA